ncbi:MAG TPA: M23 family metallopeptidase [Candidatus Pullichristensenella excrementipullorum]|nr:M23 family metallopeptidase [Candidatus Pullichristensenella excrementipullorum]
MQTQTTKLIIHTGAAPVAAPGAPRRAGQKRARASRVQAGEVIVWGVGGADAERPGGDIQTKVSNKKARRGVSERLWSGRRARMAGDGGEGAMRGGCGERVPRVLFGQGGKATGEAASADSGRYAHTASEQNGVRRERAGAAEARTSERPHGEASAQGVAAGRRARRAGMRAIKNRRRSAKARLTFGERLLRNSAIACALLLMLLAARNIDTPWTRAAVEGVERALTMKIDLDGSLGSLSFVRDLMPESVLVFFDLSSQSELAAPVEGDLQKRFSDEQPWVEFSCAPEADVVAAEAGTVVATTQLSGGGWGVMIEHDNALESVCAYLLEPSVVAGERVERGQVIARSEAGRVYFEVRRDGAFVDPAPLLGA